MVCIGARFDDRITGRLNAFSPNSKKIHIDVDPSSINKGNSGGPLFNMSLGLKPGASPEMAVTAFGGCVLLGIAIFSGYALLFSTAPMVRGYARARRWIEGSLAVFFAGAGSRLLFSH